MLDCLGKHQDVVDALFHIVLDAELDHRVLIQEWTKLLQKRKNFRHSDVLFTMLLKSLAKDRVDETLLSQLIRTVIECIQDKSSCCGLILRKELNGNLATFFCQFFLLYSEIDLISIYFNQINSTSPETLMNLTFPFLRILINFTFFFQMNCSKRILQLLIQIIQQDKIQSQAAGLIRRMFVLHAYHPRRSEFDLSHLKDLCALKLTTKQSECEILVCIAYLVRTSREFYSNPHLRSVLLASFQLMIENFKLENVLLSPEKETNQLDVLEAYVKQRDSRRKSCIRSWKKKHIVKQNDLDLEHEHEIKLSRLMYQTVLYGLNTILLHQPTQPEDCCDVLYQLIVSESSAEIYNVLISVLNSSSDAGLAIFVTEKWCRQILIDALEFPQAIEFLNLLIQVNRTRYGSSSAIKSVLYPTYRSVITHTNWIPQLESKSIGRMLTLMYKTNRTSLIEDELQEGLATITQDLSTFSTPELKLEWLQDFYLFHKSRNHFAEAAVCKERQASVLLAGEKAKDAALALLKAAKNYEKAQLITQAVRVLEIVAQMSKTYREKHKIYQKLASITNIDESRTLAEYAYFRVVLDNQTFVYKRDPFTSLGDFILIMKQSYPNLKILPESKAVEPCMHITTVEWCGPSTFRYSLPFTLSGNAYGKTHEQFKREITLYLVNSFPTVKTRIKVANHSIRVKCPIENSIDDIERRNRLLQSEIQLAKENPTPDCKTLAHVLKGSVDTHVHGGIPEIIELFLSNSNTELIGTKETELFRNQLKQSLSSFMDLAQEALQINREFNPSTLLQLEFEKGFEQIKTLLNGIITS